MWLTGSITRFLDSRGVPFLNNNFSGTGYVSSVKRILDKEFKATPVLGVKYHVFIIDGPGGRL
jgi:hypothetical protein